MNKKVLIIKTGEFETFNSNDYGSTPSLGDVVRTTPLISIFDGDVVHWVTSRECLPLFRNVQKISILNSDDSDKINLSHYDLVVNLERGSYWKDRVSQLTPTRVCGFYGENEMREPLLRAVNCESQYSIQAWKHLQKSSGKHLWQEWLFALLARNWHGEEYDLGPPKVTSKNFDIGLNWHVGNKWPSKTIRADKWSEFEKRLRGVFSVSWQRGFNDLEEYIEWIRSCRILITNDSLGMHLALAFGTKVAVFFGPTSAEEVFLYDRGKKIRFDVPADYECVPCLKSACIQAIPCTEFISADFLFNEIDDLLIQSEPSSIAFSRKRAQMLHSLARTGKHP